MRIGENSSTQCRMGIVGGGGYGGKLKLYTAELVLGDIKWVGGGGI